MGLVVLLAAFRLAPVDQGVLASEYPRALDSRESGLDYQVAATLFLASAQVQVVSE